MDHIDSVYKKKNTYNILLFHIMVGTHKYYHLYDPLLSM